MYQTLLLDGVIGGLVDLISNLVLAGGRFHFRLRLFMRSLGQILIRCIYITSGATEHHRT